MLNRYAVAIVTIAGTLALLTGSIAWFGAAPSLISMHMLLGFLTIAGLGTVAVGQALSNPRAWPLAIIALLIGALTGYIGLHQTSLLIGAYHWAIQLGHLLLGILTIGVAHMFSARQRRSATR
jgi:hypothetical protein